MMANLSEDIQCVSSDTRPPMLDRSDFESWQQRIRLYCLGKANRENILKSIDEGLFKMGKFRETLAEGAKSALHLGLERDRVFADLTPEEKERSSWKGRVIPFVFDTFGSLGEQILGLGMEGSPVPADGSGENLSTFPWSLLTKSPRRRMHVAFTCNVCGQQMEPSFSRLNTRNVGFALARVLLHLCCGCNVFHKLVENLNLFHEIKCYVNASFKYQDLNGNAGSLGFKYLDMDDNDDDDSMFPLL
ncbi:integrase, catalytic region, zinc finger, CCHC-type containing protein [Tanacetum coccineum]